MFQTLHLAARSGQVSLGVLEALHQVAGLRGGPPVERIESYIAQRAVALHRLGIDIAPEIRHLLRVIDEAARGEPVWPPDRRLSEVLSLVRNGVVDGPEISPLVRFSAREGRDLKLFIPPSIFPPGNWTRTFADGLMKNGNRERYVGKSGIELGTGSGAIALSLLLEGARFLLGLDINPDASTTALINATLNLDPDERSHIVFTESDLLDAFESSYRCDFVVGCIPQVVQAERAEVSPREAADVYPTTGEFEDLFGFGLLARALRQAQAHLNEGGWVEFVVSGRLGPEMGLELFARNGYHPTVTHSTHIPQDQDPPMSTFVALEEREGMPFRFYQNDDSRPISAHEASRYPPETISHDLFVIRGEPYRWRERKAVANLLRKSRRIGYTGDPGREYGPLRRKIAEHYRAVTGIDVGIETVFIGPAVQDLFYNLARAAASPGESVVYTRRNYDRLARARENLSEMRHLAVGESFAEIAAAIEDRSPRLAVFNLTTRERENFDGLKRIARAAAKNGTRLVTAGLFHRRSREGDYPIARLLREMPGAAEHLIVLNDLSRRYSLSTGRLSYALIPDPALYQAMVHQGEATYSRAALLAQHAAERVMRRTPAASRTVASLRVSEKEPPRFRHPDPIRIDFGESEFVPPIEMAEAIETALRELGGRDLEREAVEAAHQYLRESRGIEGVEIVPGPGVLPLQAATLRALTRLWNETPDVFGPQVGYEVHFPMVEAAGGRLRTVPTFETKITGATLRKSSREAASLHPVLLLTQPTNPGGQFYSEGEILALGEAVPGSTLLSDEVFGLTGKRGTPLHSPQALFQGKKGPRVVTFFGLSKEFGQAGGLRAGFAAMDDAELARAIRRELLTPIDPAALGASIAGFRSWETMVGPHRDYLLERRTMMEGFLKKAGIPFLPSQGGFGVLADFSCLYGRRYKGREITQENLAPILEEQGIVIKPPGWGGTPRIRLIYSIKRLPEAIGRLRSVLREIEG